MEETTEIPEGMKKYNVDVKQVKCYTVEVLAWSAEQARHEAASGKGKELQMPSDFGTMTAKKARLVEDETAEEEAEAKQD